MPYGHRRSPYIGLISDFQDRPYGQQLLWTSRSSLSTCNESVSVHARSTQTSRRAKPITKLPNSHCWTFCAITLVCMHRPIQLPALAYATSNDAPLITKIAPNTANWPKTARRFWKRGCARRVYAVRISCFASERTTQKKTQLFIWKACRATQLVL